MEWWEIQEFNLFNIQSAQSYALTCVGNKLHAFLLLIDFSTIFPVLRLSAVWATSSKCLFILPLQLSFALASQTFCNWYIKYCNSTNKSSPSFVGHHYQIVLLHKQRPQTVVVKEEVWLVMNWHCPVGICRKHFLQDIPRTLQNSGSSMLQQVISFAI